MTVADEAFRERWEVVHDRLRAMILRGELSPSERVREVQLAGQFGVSRGPVREALRMLETEGLVVRRQRLGSFVAPLDRQDVREIYELRETVEVLAITLAMERNPLALRHGLERAFEDLQAVIDTQDVRQLASADLRFHGTFYDAADNQRLLAVWNGLRDPLQVMVSVSGGRGAELANTIERHVPILKAVQERDVDKGVTELRRHLSEARDRISAYVAAVDAERNRSRDGAP